MSFVLTSTAKLKRLLPHAFFVYMHSAMPFAATSLGNEAATQARSVILSKFLERVQAYVG